MNLTHLEAIQLVQKLAYALDQKVTDSVEVSVHPPFTALRSVQTIIDADDLPIALGAQDVHWEDKGAFTGEISPGMLSKLNVSYVIVGHSERRQLFSETDEAVSKKVKAVIDAGMTPILCVGETVEEREAGMTEAKVLGQVRSGTSRLDPEAVADMVVAYEPIWAIGTGLTASPEDARSVCAAIRSAVSTDHGSAAGDRLRIQYGGSVSSANIEALMVEPDIDGVLVGGASLDPLEFAQIASFGQR
jgi:triosephosphate isomerase